MPSGNYRQASLDAVAALVPLSFVDRRRFPRQRRCAIEWLLAKSKVASVTISLMRSATIAGTAVCVLLAGCAHPEPGPNAGAAAMQASSDVPLATQPTGGQEARAVVAIELAVDFNTENSSLTFDGTRKLDIAARLFRDVNPGRMFVSEHSDNVGDEYPNLLLSARRAQVVKAGLVARGIPSDRLLLHALGMSDPAQGTASEPVDNRRVTVTWRLLWTDQRMPSSGGGGCA